jgi:hypothetical protein
MRSTNAEGEPLGRSSRSAISGGARGLDRYKPPALERIQERVRAGDPPHWWPQKLTPRTPPRIIKVPSPEAMCLESPFAPYGSYDSSGERPVWFIETCECRDVRPAF